MSRRLRSSAQAAQFPVSFRGSRFPPMAARPAALAPLHDWPYRQAKETSEEKGPSTGVGVFFDLAAVATRAAIIAIELVVAASPVVKHGAGLCDTSVGHHDSRTAVGDHLIPLEPRQAVFEDEGGASFLAQQTGDDFRLSKAMGSVDTSHVCCRQRTVAPGLAPWSASSRNRSLPPSPAERIMPSDRPKRILRGARLAMNTTLRPTSFSGSP